MIKLFIHVGPDKKFFERKIVIILFPINLDICFGCSKEQFH